MSLARGETYFHSCQVDSLTFLCPWPFFLSILHLPLFGCLQLPAVAPPPDSYPHPLPSRFFLYFKCCTLKRIAGSTCTRMCLKAFPSCHSCQNAQPGLSLFFPNRGTCRRKTTGKRKKKVLRVSRPSIS